MRFRILYDNEAGDGFRSGWGFSCLVGDHTLFDTGGDVGILLFNAQRLGVRLDEITRVVFSHEHGDHTGGYQIIEKLGEVEVYILRSFSRYFKNRLSSLRNVRLREVARMERIGKCILTTGELGFLTREQSLIVETDRGVIVITGCSHPGLDRILKVASRVGEVYGVIGGFHGFSRLEALKDLKLIAPCHCTARKRDIFRLYPDSTVRCYAGCEIEV